LKTRSVRTECAAHWGATAAMDFFTVEAITLAGLVRYHVLFMIDLASRRVEIAGIVHQPHEAWMLQIARNLNDAIDGFLFGKHYLIMDRDPLFTRAFRTMLADSGVDSVRLRSRSPNLNAYAARQSVLLARRTPASCCFVAATSPR
jgi:putative transposase